MIRISLARLDKEEIVLDGEEPSGMLDLAADKDGYTASTPIRYHLLARKAPGGATVAGTLEVTVKGECGRCLEPVEQPVSTGKILLYLEAEEQAEELDLTPEVRSELLLVMPMTLLCREDCAGLCPHCGTNLNVESCDCESRGEPAAAAGSSSDSAWNALDQLKF